MLTVRLTTVIQRPIEDVFDFISNMENWPKCEAGVVRVRNTSGGQRGVGATAREVRRPFGLRFTTEYVTTEYEPYKAYGFRGASRWLTFEGRYSIVPLRSGANLYFTFQMSTDGIMKPLEGILAYKVRKELEHIHRNLKRTLESRADRVGRR